MGRMGGSGNGAEPRRRLREGWKESLVHVWWTGLGREFPCFHPGTDLTVIKGQRISSGSGTKRRLKKDPKRHPHLCLMKGIKT